MPRVLQGRFPAISMDSFEGLQPSTGGSQTEFQNFSDMYQQAVDQVFRGVGKEVFESLKTVDGVRASPGPDSESLYPKAQIGRRLHEIAQLIKSDVGLEVAVTDMGGWDTHINQGNGKGQLADGCVSSPRRSPLSEKISARSSRMSVWLPSPNSEGL